MNKRLTNGLRWGLVLMVPLLLFSCTGTISSSTSSSEVPPEIMQAAQEGLTKLPSIVRNTSPDAKLTLGEFFVIHTMHPDAIMSATQEAGSLIESTGMWQAMVLSDEQPFLMMTIDKMDGKWKTVVYGANRFAGELFQVRKAWPKKDGFRLSNIRIYQATADVIQVVDGKGKEVGFVPLTSAAMAFGLEQRFNPTYVLADSSLLSASQKVITASRQQQL